MKQVFIIISFIVPAFCLCVLGDEFERTKRNEYLVLYHIENAFIDAIPKAKERVAGARWQWIKQAGIVMRLTDDPDLANVIFAFDSLNEPGAPQDSGALGSATPLSSSHQVRTVTLNADRKWNSSTIDDALEHFIGVVFGVPQEGEKLLDPNKLTNIQKKAFIDRWGNP